MLKRGDRVRVIKGVWDDHREKDWFGWEGIIEEVERTLFMPTGYRRRIRNPYPYYVFFPKSRGYNRNFDFAEDELELIQ